ncbi:hypothetical protein [Thalassospira profundimaris]|nr:hypothetical protein [Thalassospira profundimaris]
MENTHLTWMKRAEDVEALNPDICFVLNPDIYIGDPDDSSQFDNPALSLPLTQPKFEHLVAPVILSSELQNHEPEMVAYYRNIIDLASEHGLPFNDISHYFWLRLWLWRSDQGPAASAPWWDSFGEMIPFFDALETHKEPGLIFEDMDQGWRLQIAADDQFFYFRETDDVFDENIDPEDEICFRVPKQDCLSKLREVRQRTEAIIAELSRIMGADVWTSYQDKTPEFHHGNWRPKLPTKRRKKGFLQRLFGASS